MRKRILQVAGLVVSLGGMALGFVSNLIDEKKRDIAIDEKIEEKFEARFGKKDEESEDNEGEEA